jgi:predicted molibdopterin-dependent oxidoreductase YjgC
MRTRTTVCARDCYDTCSLLITLDDAGKIVSIKGDPHHPIIRAGQEVNVTNTYGTVRMRVAISENVPEGVLWAPRQSEGLNGAPQNCLTSSTPQKIGHGPRFNSASVRVVV